METDLNWRAVQWVVKKIKWTGKLGVNQGEVGVRLRLGERGSASTHLLQTIQTHRKKHTDIQTKNTHTDRIICTAEGVSFSDVFNRKIAPFFLKS